MNLAQAVKKFEGFLIGTKHSTHTIACYRSDLATFEAFLKQLAPRKLLEISNLNFKDLQRYSEYLTSQGMKTNTRRRKLLTVRRVFRFLHSRKKLSLNVASRLPAPHKLEKTPKTFVSDELLAKVRALQASTPLALRNRLMLWVMLETGCLVSELVRLKWTDLGNATVSLRGAYAERDVVISTDLAEEFLDWKAIQASAKAATYIFSGFNRFGPLHERVTPRGVEMMVRGVRPVLGPLTPRLIRSSVILGWLRSKVPRSEITRRLGLKTQGVFRVYEPLLGAPIGSLERS